MTGLLVIMGSGETAPTMVKPHREILQRCGDLPAVLLDTPYGFQENADDISAKAVKYFADSTGRRLSVVGWRTVPEPGLPRERALAALREAGWLFAGPGSPTYALRQWTDTEFPAVLTEVLGAGRVVCFASAAALTLGSHTIPVYEIYKAGIEPHWVPGLDLFHRATGLPAVLVPHYDNAEGGHHDTRFCYLGERRLSALEPALPAEAFIIGIDEHTAGLFDLATRSVRVVGNGGLTLRRGGRSQWWPAGTTLPFSALAAGSFDAVAAAPEVTAAAEALPPTSLSALTLSVIARFDACYEAREADGCVAAALDLEQALQDWVADTDVSDEREQARASLRRMLVRLGSFAGPDRFTPLVAALVGLRTSARSAKDWALSDALRDVLASAGVTVRDTPAGAEWTA
ncbi:CysS/YqeB C-terminal domain-containing protein [Dactylosporangium salmoneum]|uniref:Cysteinyl-tRNA ligase anticodon binding domain-containing protein n=1 Tax=Dactylosporangium salmoneum TaxID=53361 RepID=A0ABN3I0P1_9ACTN